MSHDFDITSKKKLYITGPIDYDSYKDFSESLAEIEEDETDIIIELVSDGGEATAALAFSSRLRLSPCYITIVALGNVASAATLILASGDSRYMTKESWAMVHEDSGETSGSVTEMEREVQHLRAMEHQWNALLAKLTGTEARVWQDYNKRTTYFTAEECLKLGLIDKII